MTTKKLAPVHPGEVLLEEFLIPFGLSQNRLALSVGVPPRRINEIVLRKCRVTAETALRLARFFDTTPQSWLGLQDTTPWAGLSTRLPGDERRRAGSVGLQPPCRPLLP